MTDKLFGYPIKVVETDEPVPSATFGDFSQSPYMAQAKDAEEYRDAQMTVGMLRKRMELPPSEVKTPPLYVPDGIPIGQRPTPIAPHLRTLIEEELKRRGAHPDQEVTKGCDHDWDRIEDRVIRDPDGDGIDTLHLDLFYCRRCLDYREVKR